MIWILAESTTSSALLGLGLLLIIAILLRRSYRYYRDKDNPNAILDERRAGRCQPRKQTPLIDAPPEIVRWQIEMHETARDLKAELDSKMSALQALVGMAQQASDRLEAVIARAAELGVSSVAGPLDQIEQLTADPPDDAAEKMRQLREPFSRPPTTLPGTAQQRSAIYALADLGHDPAAIADQVGASLGDVELILSARAHTE